MTMGLRGDDLAYAALDHIREHMEEWDQESYFCGTTACFAGRVILLADAHDLQENPYPARARKLLGWTRAQANKVFYCYTKDFTVLETLVKEVLNGEI